MLLRFPSTIVLTIALLAPFAGHLIAASLGTAFTYQGRLTDGGNSANGSYDLKFTLFDTNSGGTAVAGPLTNSAVAVSNGLFVTTLDFGSGAFSGDARWLELGVRTNGSAGNFTALSPRQPLTPAPYAIMANSASNLLGALPATQSSGIVTNVSLMPLTKNVFTVTNPLGYVPASYGANLVSIGTGSGYTVGTTIPVGTNALTPITVTPTTIGLALFTNDIGAKTNFLLQFWLLRTNAIGAGGDVFLANNNSFTGSNNIPKLNAQGIFNGSGTISNAVNLGGNPPSYYASTGSVVSINQNGSVYPVPVTLDFTNGHVIGQSLVTNLNVSQYGSVAIQTWLPDAITVRGSEPNNDWLNIYTNTGLNTCFVQSGQSARWFTNDAIVSGWRLWFQSGWVATNSTLLGRWTNFYGSVFGDMWVEPVVADNYSISNYSAMPFVSGILTNVGQIWTNYGPRALVMVPINYNFSATGTPIALVTIGGCGFPNKISFPFYLSMAGTSGSCQREEYLGFVNPSGTVTITDASSGTGASVTIDTAVGGVAEYQ